MMARPIHHFLKEFGSGETSFQPPMPTPDLRIDVPVVAAPPAPDPVEMQVQDAYQQGLEAGRAFEREQSEAQAAEMVIDFNHRLEEAQKAFSVKLAESLADEFRAGLEAARLSISSHVATALMPLLRNGLTHSAIHAFVAELDSMIESAEGMTVEVVCPRALMEPVRAALGEAMARRGAPPGTVRCMLGDNAEVRVAINDTVLETRLADWLSRLEGVLH
jgi:hypothetical protein